MAKNFNKALDTNEVIALYNISKGIKPKYANQDKDFILSIYHLYDLVENSEFSFYITTEIFSEIQKGVEKYKVNEKNVELNFDVEHTQNIRYIYFLKVAKQIAPKWMYEYKNQRIYITIPITADNNLKSQNSYIYQLMEFMEKM